VIRVELLPLKESTGHFDALTHTILTSAGPRHQFILVHTFHPRVCKAGDNVTQLHSFFISLHVIHLSLSYYVHALYLFASRYRANALFALGILVFLLQLATPA
jgi:hypothetical protein